VGEGVHGEANQGSLSISRSQGGMEVQFWKADFRLKA
jgi:hypothetical protein